jgi:hypothetical protein
MSSITFENYVWDKHNCVFDPTRDVEDPTISAGNKPLDCIARAAIAYPNATYITDEFGTPEGFQAYQELGKVKFKFADYSQCEEAFSFTRASYSDTSPTGFALDASAFVDDFYSDNGNCGEKLAPETSYDDLMVSLSADDEVGRTPGTLHDYTVKAVSNIGVGATGYVSKMISHARFRVGWEAVVAGQVISKDARLPINDVTVSYTVDGASNVAGTDVTLRDGKFRLHILDNNLNSEASIVDRVKTVVLTFSKQSYQTSTVVDKIQYEEITCPSSNTSASYFLQGTKEQECRSHCDASQVCGTVSWNELSGVCLVIGEAVTAASTPAGGTFTKHTNSPEQSSPAYILIPAGTTCEEVGFDVLSNSDCKTHALSVVPAGATAKRAFSTCNGVTGCFGEVPAGCNLQSGGDWTPVFNTGAGAPSTVYRTVCSASGLNRPGASAGTKCNMKPPPFKHSFVCAGEDCGGAALGCKFDSCRDNIPIASLTLEISHLSFDNFEIIEELSSVPFAGTVYFPVPNIAVELPQLAGVDPTFTKWRNEWDNGERCLLHKAKVCLHDHNAFGSEVVCTVTDAYGAYKLPAPPGLHLSVRVTLGSHVHTDFRRYDASEKIYYGMTMLPLAAPSSAANENGNTLLEEVFSISPGTKDYEQNMDYQDHTVRLLRVGAHGTLCKLPLGNAATFTLQHNACKQIPLDLPTAQRVDSIFLLPAHQYAVTFEAVSPHYPEATDKSQVGYFHRLRTRVRHINLFDEPDTAGILHSAIFEYHPRPALAIHFLTGSDPTESLVDPVEMLDCSADASASDLQLQAQQGEDYQKFEYRVDQIPRWAVPAGTPLTSEVKVTATIRFPVDVLSTSVNENAMCDWVEGNIRHFSRLGLSAEDQFLLGMDPFKVEHRDFIEVLSRTLPAVNHTHLKTCTDPNDPAYETECTINTTHTPIVTIRTDFGDDETCTVSEAGVTATDFAPLSSGTLCTESAAMLQGAEGRRAWHTLTWTVSAGIDADPASGLTKEEQDAWTTVGLTQPQFDAATVTKVWSTFSAAITNNLLAWSNLTCPQQKAAANTLRYTEVTWGRGWAFAERIFHSDFSLLPSWTDDLSNTERLSMEGLFKDAASVWDTATPFKTVPWSALSSTKQMHATALGLTEWQWDWTRSLSVRIADGCFWDQARGSPVTSIWKSIPGTAAIVKPKATRCFQPGRDRERRQLSCPTGMQQSNEIPSDGDGTCVDCPVGSYKNSSMPVHSQCAAKLSKAACALLGEGHFVGPSVSEDDSKCIPKGYCPPGLGNVEGKCEACKAGMFQLLVSPDACLEKTVRNCKAGEYFTVGSSRVFNDNLCIGCPVHTFSVDNENRSFATAATCTPKQAIDSCAPGTYLDTGTSTTEDDTKCTPCEANTFKDTNTPFFNATARCSPKAASSCSPGFYFRQGSSLIVDDNVCIPCPAGTYTATDSADSTCLPKSPTVCPSEQKLFPGLSKSSNDYACVAPGECPAGFYYESDTPAPPSVASDDTGAFTVESNDAITEASQIGLYTFQQTLNGAAVFSNGFYLIFFGGTVDGWQWVPSYGDFGGKGPMLSTVTSARDFVYYYIASSSVNPSKSFLGCTSCPPLTYSSSTSTETVCNPKTVSHCDDGFYIFDAGGTTVDASRCRQCPFGTWKGAEHPRSTLACYLKKPLEVKCGDGMHVSLGFSVTADDHSCQRCGQGQYKKGANEANYCLRKAGPTTCKAGMFVDMSGESTSKDDWTCSPCPDKHFKSADAAMAEATLCIPKTLACKNMDVEELITSNDATKDNVCIIKGHCGAGERVLNSASGTTCEVCPAGQYNPGTTTSEECIPKSAPSTCSDGMRFSRAGIPKPGDGGTSTGPAPPG